MSEEKLPMPAGWDERVGAFAKAVGKDMDLLQLFCFFAPQGIDRGKGFDGIAEERDAQGLIFFVGRKDFHHIPPDPKGPPMEVEVVSFI